MRNGKSTAPVEEALLRAEDIAGLVGVKETTVYKWCKEGKLPCLKVGKHWRIRREGLEDFLKGSERSRTLVGHLDSFLRVPDNVMAIAQNIDILRRLDAAFFRVGEARGGCWSSSTAGRRILRRSYAPAWRRTGLRSGAWSGRGVFS
jgi:excisionase family DNA binding protein